jgi:O-methyltransferase involved in polyketide biosynthesis
MWSTLRFIAGLPGGAQVVFDYSDPPATLSAEDRTHHDLRAARVAELGESWLNYLDGETLAAGLKAAGFQEIEDLGPTQIAERFFPSRAADARTKGGHILHAGTVPVPVP